MIDRSDFVQTLLPWINLQMTMTGHLGRFGDGDAPTQDATVPYGILYDSDGGSYGTEVAVPMLAPWSEGVAVLPMQFNCVGDRLNMARLMADRLRAILEVPESVPAPVGWKVIEVEPDGPSSPVYEGELPHRRVTLPEQYLFKIVES